MKRNRIIINLENLRARPREGGASGCIKILVAAVLVIVLIVGATAVGVYLWWRHYQSSPAYALALLTDAAQRNDSVAIDGILDYEKIAVDFSAQVRQKLLGSSALSSLWPSQADTALPVISDKLKNTIHEQLNQELRDLTDVAKNKPFIIIALGVPRFAAINEEGKTAQATVNIKNEQIKLTLERQDDRWRIVGVQDEKLAKMVADAVVKSIPGVNQVQGQINKQLENLKKK
jgi:hypothetical protein